MAICSEHGLVPAASALVSQRRREHVPTTLRLLSPASLGGVAYKPKNFPGAAMSPDRWVVHTRLPSRWLLVAHFTYLARASQLTLYSVPAN